jgi:hypothetical protein
LHQASVAEEFRQLFQQTGGRLLLPRAPNEDPHPVGRLFRETLDFSGVEVLRDSCEVGLLAQQELEVFYRDLRGRRSD